MQDLTLQSLYKKYDIINLKPGKKYDSLGDLYEEYYETVLTDKKRFDVFNSGISTNEPEQIFFNKVMNFHNIQKVQTVVRLVVPKTKQGGEPKTDVALLINSWLKVKATIKATSAKNVTVAEYSADAIIESLDIKDEETIRLLHKHQRDTCAKNFTSQEKVLLKERLFDIKKNMVRWALTGSPSANSQDIRVADFSCCFKLDKNNKLKNYSLFTTEDCVNIIASRTAGFGTGLSWTYATNSKGERIQFKAPVL